MRVLKLVIAASVLTALAGISTAPAADLAARPYTKAPIMDPVYNWTGFYIGGNAGYSWGRSRTDMAIYNNGTNALLATGSGSFDMNGWVAGAQVGYNWQMQRWVWGVEGDIQATGQRGSASFVCPGTICSSGLTAVAPATAPVTVTVNNKLTWFSTIRARAGYTFTPTAMGYVTGGLAIGEVNSGGVISGFGNANPAPVISSSYGITQTRAGWTVGAGVEASLGGNWTGKVEYLYMDLGKYSATGVLLTNSPALRVTTESRITDNIVRAGVNYRWGGPVVAKY